MNTGESGGCYIDDVFGIAFMRRLQAISTTWVLRHDLCGGRKTLLTWGQYIDVDLTRLYNLDLSTKENQ
jgi:hypothetical protein